MKYFWVELVPAPRSGPRVKKKFQKTLILAFEVILQPPKHTFEIGIFFLRILAYCVLFSKMCCFLRKFVVEKTMVFGNNPKYVCRCHPYYFIIVTKCMYIFHPPPSPQKIVVFSLEFFSYRVVKNDWFFKEAVLIDHKWNFNKAIWL